MYPCQCFCPVVLSGPITLTLYFEPHFSAGDVVRLKSGGPHMTVGKVARSEKGDRDLYALCYWHDGSDEAQTEAFVVAALEKVDANE